MRSRRLNSPTLAGGFASQASQAMEVITRSLQARFICLLLQNARRWTLKCCWGARGPFTKQRMATLRVGHTLFVMGGQIDPIDPDPSYTGEKSKAHKRGYKKTALLSLRFPDHYEAKENEERHPRLQRATHRGMPPAEEDDGGQLDLVVHRATPVSQ